MVDIIAECTCYFFNFEMTGATQVRHADDLSTQTMSRLKNVLNNCLCVCVYFACGVCEKEKEKREQERESARET